MTIRTAWRWRWLLTLLLALPGVAQTTQPVEIAAAEARRWVATPAREERIEAYGPAADIRYRVYETPKPLRVWIATIDLGAPGVRFAVTDPATFSGEEAKFETRCNTTLEFARQRGVQLAINTSAFDPLRSTRAAPMDVVGLAAVRGQRYSGPDERFGAMYIGRDGRIALKGPPLPQDELWHVIPGFQLLLDDGQIVVTPQAAASKFGDVNPRTAVGVDRAGRKLWIMVIDGRQPGVSAGITLVELACLFESLGAWDALNLDGGGSTTLVLERADGTHAVINAPGGAKKTLRQVANNLGLYVPGPKLAASGAPPATWRDAVIQLAGARRGGGYQWSGDGVSRDIVYDGQTILRANSEGTYCCGATLGLFLDAYRRLHGVTTSAGRWFEGWPVEKMVALQQGWYGTDSAAQNPLFPEEMRASVREKQVADMLVWAGLAQSVADYRQFERGDFVEFWRTNGSGHSVVFWARDYDEDGRERLWYWSSQPKARGTEPLTPGYGVNWEYVGDEIDPARIYGVRLNEPVPAPTSQPAGH